MKVLTSEQARIARLAAENSRLRESMALIRAAESARDEREQKARIARYAHRDGTTLVTRQGGKSAAESAVLIAGRKPGDVAVSGLEPLVVRRVSSGIK